MSGVDTGQMVGSRYLGEVNRVLATTKAERGHRLDDRIPASEPFAIPTQEQLHSPESKIAVTCSNRGYIICSGETMIVQYLDVLKLLGIALEQLRHEFQECHAHSFLYELALRPATTYDL